MNLLTTCFLLGALGLATCKETVRHYDLVLTYAWDKQDGHGRPTFFINGTTPGPVLTVAEGEVMEVNVINELQIESTLHWHGIYQIDEPWSDGVPGVTQYSIEPRDNFVYRFTAQHQYGSYFYHGHFGPAFSDGQRGPIWIIPADWRPRPYDLISDDKKQIRAMREAEKNPRHIIIADWNGEPMDGYLIRFRDTGYIPVCSNALTLNAKGQTKCNSAREIEEAGGPGRNERGCVSGSFGHEFVNPELCTPTHTNLEVVQAEEGEEWVWINWINSGAHHMLSISIDEHEFWVVAADGEFVHPQHVAQTHVNLGERISILVHLNQKPGDYAIRLNSLRYEQVIEGWGILRYPTKKNLSGTSNSTVPNTKSWVHLNGTLKSDLSMPMNDKALHPFPPKPPPQKADFTLKFAVNMTGPATWVLNANPHEFFRQQIPPILWDEKSRGNTSYGNPHGWLHNGSVVDLIIQNGHKVDSMHPFHKHNHKVWIIGQGEGGFPGNTVEEALENGAAKDINLIDPPYRDGFTLEAGEGHWTVIRYEVWFPAVSMLHCHMIHHFASGQQVILLEGTEKLPKVPDELKHKPHAEFPIPVRYGPLD